MITQKPVIASFSVLVLLVAGCVAVSFVVPSGPNVGELSDRLQPPSLQAVATGVHPLGTDHLGRDLLVRLLYSGQISLTIGVASVFLSGTLGVLVGLLGGYFGGPFDYVLMRVTDMQLAIPFLALAVLISAVIGPGVLSVIAVLGLAGWVLYARVIRSLALTTRELEYVLAVRAVGATTRHILLRTILPNVSAPMIVVASLTVSQMIIAESSLSFIGLGVTPATPTWGMMLSDARDYLRVAWWVPTLPGVAITATVVAINVIGDWLRDLLDPRLRRGVSTTL